ncbi:trans-sulfuration enzyme family protein [Lacihabitans soyangensis]|uniref:Aminotransferase class I/II-fold pyridoxal phosphate-dependent enzyme n=1 Tax=Lacihabitans soyangensis TaxID=869394 RepID=A0AAE3H3T2_9BACT|nr:aminotransferase class I/II-fold pyridoxal phosphate-dependent enzyme [Lacihabitans soyangensis]MCP9764614.1 aminotransferase class I/II-fold pyridoxal phosphate-dependent enzyme [Lacihabitans soyangensis]
MASLETALIHQHISPEISGAVVPPLVQSTTFCRDPKGDFIEGRDIYTRASNPNRRLLENKLALLEKGTDAACFASGQAATMSIFHSLGQNSHVILPDDIYYGTRVILENLYKNWNIEYTVVDMANSINIEKAIRPNTKLVWIESPSNPCLKIADIATITDICTQNRILTAVDNTWSSPYFTNPLALGADIVMHSTTKYLGGHSDILGGAVIWGDKLEADKAQSIKDYQSIGGGVPSPYDCWLLNRSLSTFFVRMAKHNSNAAELANFLSTHPKIERVYYPGLVNHQNHEIAKKQMTNGFGGMMSILIKGDEKNCLAVASKLKVFQHATSLGGVESLVDHRRTAEGVHSVSVGNLLRISVGIENIEDLIEDFAQALS